MKASIIGTGMLGTQEHGVLYMHAGTPKGEHKKLAAL